MKKALTTIISIVAAALMLTAAVSADSTVSAPTKIWYKLLNHDKVSLKWDAVSGADGYAVYMLDAATSKYKKIKELTVPKYTLTGLAPYTEYTCAVTALKKSGGKVTESRMRRISFTTPEEWYYTLGNGSYTDEEDPAYDSEHIYRRHYNGSGAEKFDFFSLIPKDELLTDNEKSYDIAAVTQNMGYVYVYYEYIEILDDTWIELYRFKNDGTSLENTHIGGRRPDHTLFLDADTGFMGYDSGINGGGELLYVTDAVVSKTVIHKDGRLSALTMFRQKRTYLSNFVSDGTYLYYFTTPYHGRTYDEDEDEDDDDAEPEELACLWRTRIDAPEKLTYDKNDRLSDPEQDTVTDCLCGIHYEYDDQRIYLIGCRNGYLYYVIRGDKNKDKLSEYTFWRISPTGENDTPEKMFSLKVKTLADARIHGNYMYLLGDGDGYRVTLAGRSTKPKKIFTIGSDGFSWSFGTLNSSQVEIIDGYIYFSGRFGSRYYRVKLSGKDLRKSSKPFLWK